MTLVLTIMMTGVEAGNDNDSGGYNDDSGVAAYGDIGLVMTMMMITILAGRFWC